MTPLLPDTPRTMTVSEASDVLNDVMNLQRSLTNALWIKKGIESLVGVTIVPDPEPVPQFEDVAEAEKWLDKRPYAWACGRSDNKTWWAAANAWPDKRTSGHRTQLDALNALIAALNEERAR